MATTKRTKTTTTKAKPAGATAIPATSTGGGAVSLDAVAVRAYELWQRDGCVDGNAHAHWFQAEQELRTRAALA